MTSAEFRAALAAAGLRQRALAERLGVETSTVNRWALGKVAVPRYATAYLELLLQRPLRPLKRPDPVAAGPAS